ncbi:hypothetical protein [Natronorubrum texcoconense]|uniref:hypothetical protein n=1 Tax=Natronorubrum texcoconense TaxID=1095776 RepID=UPI0011133D73|nr:hypothetical protein [Natronorubrum texcoconense]
MERPIDEFLSKTGAIELLCEIDLDGSRFEDLNDDLPVSRQTLAVRLREASEASLIEQETIQGERGTSHKHVLSEKGILLRMQLIKPEGVAKYHQYNDSRQQWDEKKEEIREIASEATVESPNSRYTDGVKALRCFAQSLENGEKGDDGD